MNGTLQNVLFQSSQKSIKDKKNVGEEKDSLSIDT